MQNQINTSFNQKLKAIISLIMGVISIIPIVHIGASGGIPTGFAFVSLVEIFALTILSIPGMVLGIMELKSKQKKIAIVGIVFSIIGFLSLINFILMFLWAMTEGY